MHVLRSAGEEPVFRRVYVCRVSALVFTLVATDELNRVTSEAVPPVCTHINGGAGGGRFPR